MSTTTSFFPPTLLRGLLGADWLRPLNDPVALDDLLAMIRPTWSLTAIKAEVVGATGETGDVRTLLLRPNRLWPGHRAGQHVQVEVEIDGRRLRRTFSISSAPRPDGLVAVTVKRREGGKVSRWWNDDARVGDVITLSAPAGEFVLPSLLPRRVVMLSAGSGITPLMAMLRDLDARGHGCEVLFVHCAHSHAEVIFRSELEEIARRRPWLELRMHLAQTSGRLGEESLSRLAAEAADAPVFVCGPQGFMDAARSAWRAAGREQQLHFEWFGLPTRVAETGVPEPVRAERSGVTFVAEAGQSLLEAAEAAGLRPAHGCRIGVCHTCKCRKLSGVVEDLRDGRLSVESGEMIQLCVSTARSAVTLEL
ncbi:MAG: ferredoxin reductase [Candidatus Binatia bacterium]